ncbi:altronate dehydratase family protein [Hephaestia sp. MAHUQ-44]|nr:altronate dehydratase family protein [Hephaestia sp. MAHUQ-44]MCM8731066.1 altronate dehydratase family protein [Hephaestia sp. MAHUQ-44]
MAAIAAVLIVNPEDNVATALRDLGAGETIDIGDTRVTLREAVPRGHKLASVAIPNGAPVIKFGASIGRATADVARGAHVHSHNMVTGLSGDARFAFTANALSPRPTGAAPTFLGYARSDGRVGTRNEIWVIPTVGCVARTAERIAAAGARRFGEQVDGIHAFGHPHGCSQLGNDLESTRAILAALACHPNAGGVLLVGLGCESNQLRDLLALIPPDLRDRIETISAQAEQDETEAGLAALERLVVRAQATRTEQPLAKLVLGVKCGGSDGLSGLTANPLVGRIANRVADAGGAVIQTEIPEIFGAEQALVGRAVDQSTFDAALGLINRFKEYFRAHGEPISENPSPGNIAGGLTTLEEKSLGAVQKSGRVPLADVIGYGERQSQAGLTLLEAPGNDAVSSTALAAAGATLILFTTGRGTPLGFPVPTMKIASNDALSAAKPNWIDFNAGQVLRDGFDTAEEALLAHVIRVASGEACATERNDERAIAIWRRGVTL